MREALKAALFIVFHLLLGFVLCLLFALSQKTPDLIPPFVFSWQLRKTVLLFINYFPILIISSILLGYSLLFGKNAPHILQRYSKTQIKYLKGAFLLVLICIGILTVLTESIRPALIHAQQTAVNRSYDFYDCHTMAQRAYNEKSYKKALAATEQAAAIWKENTEIKQLADKIRIAEERLQISEEARNRASVSTEISDILGISPQKAVELAKMQMEKQDFYSAYYYAAQAKHTADSSDPIKEEATKIEVQSWEQIEKGFADINAKKEYAFFAEKRNAYLAFQQKEYIKAYYSFLSLKDKLIQTDPEKKDPDVDRFLRLSEEKLLEHVFFIDETLTLKSREFAKNITFTVSSDSIPKTTISVEGVTFASSKKAVKMYLRNCLITRKTFSDNVSAKISVPYAKLVPLINENGEEILRMQIEAVDRNKEEAPILPQLIEGYADLRDFIDFDLPVSFLDFNLIIAASNGEDSMSLAQLYSFKPIAEQYGFEKIVYEREILSRLAEPLLLLIISIYALTLAWKFRLQPGAPFRFIWIFFFPLFLIPSILMVEASRYITRLLIAFICYLSPSMAGFIGCFCLITAFICVCLNFFAQRSE